MTLTPDRGIDSENFSLAQRDTLCDDNILLTGLQATARAVADQLRADHARGLRTAAFVSGYPGSPLAGFDQALRRMDKAGLPITHIDGLNEDLAATAVWGSQQDHLAPLAEHDGVIGVWYGKAPGLDRSGDVLRHANLHGAGSSGGVVLFVGDDPGSKSSTMPSASELSLIDLGIPVLYPGTVQEVLEHGRLAFEMSRSTGLYVAVKIVTAIADGFGIARVRSEWHPRTQRDWKFGNETWTFHQRKSFFIPDTLELEAELHSRRLPAAARFLRENAVNTVAVRGPTDEIGIVAAGRTFQEVKEALRSLGLADEALTTAGIRLLKVGSLHPWDDQTAEEFVSGLGTIIVVEEKRALIERYLRDQFYSRADRPRVLGKQDSDGNALFAPDGELTADRIRPILKKVLDELVLLPEIRSRIPVASAVDQVDAAKRTSYFCSGCPHNRSTADLEVSPIGGGVGCHALVMWMDRGATSYTHMGGEGAQWIGRAPFTDVPHMIQNIGDGTYFHSGSLVPRFAVASGVNITFRILYNGVIAMTGGQMPAGQQTIPDLCQSLLGEGVKQVAVVTDEINRYTTSVRRDLPPGVFVHDRSQLTKIEVEFAKVLGVTAIIYDQACSNELRRLRKREVVPERKKRIVINEAVCEGCGDCGVKSTCLSVQPVESILGRKTQIHQGSCNTDYSCLDGDCPSFVTVEADHVPSRTVAIGDIHLPVVGPPIGIALIPADGFGVYTVGVGGTGLVTLNQILATAAAFDGLHVTGLDQTGLSQKGGPVVSHLKIFREPTEASQSISEQSVDTFIALDLLVANELRHRVRLSPERTMAVLSTSVVPTAEMILKTQASFGSVDELVASIGSCVSSTQQISLDLLAIAEGLFKDHMTANIIALGVAYQLGFLPVREESLLRAIEVNGAAVERSKKAFAVGRLAAADPVALAKLLPQHRAGQMSPSPSKRAISKLGKIALVQQFEISADKIRDFVFLLGAELIDYQNERVASEFLQTIAPLAKLERRLYDSESELTRLGALHLFRFTAVKDEYEVARLHRKSEFRAALNELVPQGKKIKYLLQPPMLSSLGLNKKIAIPSALARPTFALLAGMRRLRSTPLDVFGLARLRREERQLRLDFVADIELVVNSLCPENKADCARLLDAAATVRGFEEVKRRSMEIYYESRSLLRAAVASAASAN